jgi:hypothetical protein
MQIQCSPLPGWITSLKSCRLCSTFIHSKSFHIICDMGIRFRHGPEIFRDSFKSFQADTGMVSQSGYESFLLNNVKYSTLRLFIFVMYEYIRNDTFSQWAISYLRTSEMIVFPMGYFFVMYIRNDSSLSRLFLRYVHRK